MTFRLLIVFLSLGAGNFCSAQDNPFGISQAGLDYLTGQALFEKIWVSAPSSTQASDGLGPLYNARSCAQCHIGAGKGQLPDALILRVNNDYLGKQLQTRAVSGLAAEARVEISYDNRVVVLSDNTEVSLHFPQYNFSGVQEEIVHFSPRLAPALFGLGLLEAIPLHELLAKADSEDEDSDGISGIVGSGRFGWKADLSNLGEQIGLAFSLDIGISSELFPNPFGDCTAQQEDCLSQPNGASGQDQNLEIGRPAFASLLNFIRNIPLPAISEEIINIPGKTVFESIGCMSCHHTGYTQGTISPYSDLLLHDMGDALADTLDNALSNEWRTPPLWGLSAYQQVDNQFYLHDGRARSLIEAILWHGGEAEDSKQAFNALSTKDREDLINFLQSI
jgi:CxxC motif-containing protein (DUF1111 family)